MRNLKTLLTIVALFVFTTSCTDNTDELITNTQNTDITNAQSFTPPQSPANFFTGGGDNKGGTGKE